MEQKKEEQQNNNIINEKDNDNKNENKTENNNNEKQITQPLEKEIIEKEKENIIKTEDPKIMEESKIGREKEENNNNNLLSIPLKENNYLNPIEHKYNLSIAPMLDITNSHYMNFMRLLTKETLIYSEMINIDQIVNYKIATIDPLQYYTIDLEPVVIQFGGCDPEKCYHAAEIVKSKGFKEINLNCGCPSKRVSAGGFGAVLMEDPKLVGECVKKMNSVLFSSIKCRMGLNSYNEKFLTDFIDITKEISGITKYILHSRIAIMGIDTMKNRKVPPLLYEEVEKIKNLKKYGNINFVINGGIKNFETVREFNEKNIGVMIGREAYENPWKFRNADSQVFDKVDPKINRKELVYQYADYCRSFIDKNTNKLSGGLVMEMVRPFTNLFTGEKFNKVFVNELYKITQGSKDQKKKEEVKKMQENLPDYLYSTIEKFEKVNEEAVLSI